MSEATLYSKLAFLFKETSGQDCLFVLASDEEAGNFYNFTSFYLRQKYNVVYLPEYDCLPYDRISPAREVLFTRATTLSHLANKTPKSKPYIVVTTAKGFLQKTPPAEEFNGKLFTIKLGQKLKPETLQQILEEYGFIRTSCAITAGEYHLLGEIIDIAISKKIGYRLSFAWDEVEKIRLYAPSTQLTNADADSIKIAPCSELVINKKRSEIFRRKFLTTFGLNHTINPLYQAVIGGIHFHGIENCLALFYDELVAITSFMQNPIIFCSDLGKIALQQAALQYADFYNNRNFINDTQTDLSGEFYPSLPPADLIINQEEAKIHNSDEYNIEYKFITNFFIAAKTEGLDYLAYIASFAAKHKDKPIIVFCSNESSRAQITDILKQAGILYRTISNINEATKSIWNLCQLSFDSSQILNDCIFLSCGDLLKKQSRASNKINSGKKLENILSEVDNIKPGDLVVHTQSGIGRFEEMIRITASGSSHDCLKLAYAGGDVLYLPVQNISLIKKFGSNLAALDKLGAASWQKRSSIIKRKIKDIARKLMKIAAKRQMATTSPTSTPTDLYSKFVEAFPYIETEDQLNAAEDVSSDLTDGRLMDRLICGDVGFGKTEVAMRAAFMVLTDLNQNKPQIALIAPTTILCRQHFLTFKKRFKDTPLRIEQLSRLVPASRRSKIKHAIASDEVDIIIGTHTLLAKDIGYSNLKMIIIDEEHRFGVSQKERLKELKNNIHVLTLSATPIPRTLQMSLVGLKELSLIATPPIDRKPVKTSITSFDMTVVKDALEYEKKRDGRSFVVVPRISDIDEVQTKLRHYLPKLKLAIAHGRMKPTEIEQVMDGFAAGEYDVLLSTNIIESGIDIKEANTIIIYKADMLGLSQLYQLRGRVGRGPSEGICYLTISGAIRRNVHSYKRLEILKNLNTLGAGFSLASHDMDMRGFGNLVGDEQSGHIKEVGIELYQEMLQTSLSELKNNNEPQEEAIMPQINLGIDLYIPESYIPSGEQSLAIYRRIGNIKTTEELEQFLAEMTDRFGKPPKAALDLCAVIQLRNKAASLAIEKIDSGPNGIVLRLLNKDFTRDMILRLIAAQPNKLKTKADSNNNYTKLLYIGKIPKDSIISIVNMLLDTMAI